MNERRRYRDLTDDELVELIRGLPRRAPRPALRDQVLSAPAPARAANQWRPAFALAALVVLLFADWLALRWTATSSPAGPPPAALGQVQIATRDDLAFAQELAYLGLPLRLAQQVTSPSADNYLTLRNRLLAPG